jgi:hypothetical protein
MKKIILLFTILLCTTFYAQNYPGKSIELLSGKKLKVLPISLALQKYGYRGFYKDENLKKIYKDNNSYSSEYLSLVDKIFSVVGFEPYKNILGTDKFKLILQNEEIGKIYFDYDPVYNSSFVFEVVGGLTFPENYFCQYITESTDKFSGDIKYRSEDSEGISFVKFIENNTAKIYISISVVGLTLNVGKTGLILLLENNKRIEKPDALIDVKVKSSSWSYSAFVELNSKDLDLLKENKITDERLFIYDGVIKNGEKLKEYIKCLTK